MFSLRALALDVIRKRYARDNVHFVTSDIDSAYEHLPPLCEAVQRVQRPSDPRMAAALAALESSGVFAVRIDIPAVGRYCARFVANERGPARPAVRGSSAWDPHDEFQKFDPAVHIIVVTSDPVLVVLQKQNIFAVVPRSPRKNKRPRRLPNGLGATTKLACTPVSLTTNM